VSERGWLTPNSGATEDICRSIVVPLDDQLQLLAAVNGALAELTKEHNWTQFGDMTPAETAELMFSIYEDYVASDCTAGCICEVPLDPTFGVEITVRILRRSETGHTQELVDGEWVTPTGDYEVPPIPEREEATAAERICLAAANAVNVLETIYEEVTDAWSAAHTSEAVFSAIFDAAISLLGLFAGPTAAGHAAFGKTIFDTFVETVDALAADVWSASFTEELICFMREYATDTAGVVTFDWPNMRQAIFDEFIDSAFNFDRALLWSQVGYLFDILAAGGIDTAGATTAITTYDCDYCDETGWCYVFDFTGGSANGWTFVNNNAGNPFGSAAAGGIMYGDLRDPAATGSAFRRIVMQRAFPSTPISLESIEVTYDYTFAGDGVASTVFIRTSVNGSLQQSFTRAQIIAGDFNTGTNLGYQKWEGNFASPTSVLLDWSARIDSSSPFTYNGNVRIKTVTLRGLGTNPFGADNCP